MKRPFLTPLFFSVRLPTLLAMFWRAHISRKRTAGPPRKEPLSFIVFRLDSLGDVVMTTPLFRALKQAHAKCRCTVVVQGCYKSLLVTNPYIDEVLTLQHLRPACLPQGLRRLLSAAALYWTRLRKKHFDYAISPRWDVDEHLATFLCLLTNAASRVGYSENSSPAKQRINRGFDKAYNVCLPPGPVRHEVLRNLAIAEALGAAADDSRLQIQVSERDRRKAEKILSKVPNSTRLIALGIGAQSRGRRWPLERYAATIERLANEFAVQPVIAVSEAELAQGLELASLMSKSPIILSGSPLRELCAVLERCELFIGNDSGCAHLAAAMDCQTIVISRHPRDGDPDHFNSPLRFAPHCRHVRVLQPASGLEDCRNFCRATRPHCIKRIQVDDVVSAARLMLSRMRPVVAPGLARSSPGNAEHRLLNSHCAAAIERAIATLHGAAEHPSAPA